MSHHPNVTRPVSVADINRQINRSFLIPTVIFGLFLIAGCCMLTLNSLESHVQWIYAEFSAILLLLLLQVHITRSPADRRLIFLLDLSLLYIIILSIMPEYLWGEKMDGILHRSLISSIVLIALSLTAFSSSLAYLCGGTPSAKQLAGYPLIILPVIIIVVIYLIMIVQTVIKGVPNLDWTILTSFFHYEGPTKVPGMANYILGTITLIVLTSVISLPIDIGTGIFISEYGGRLSGFIRICTTSLRSISVFILALGAYSVVKYSQGTIFHDIINGFPGANHGSALLASLFLSLLVIPVISRVTEEGCRSLPNSLREGSVAMGASEAYKLRQIILPCSIPNILTGLLLGCAKAAGSVGLILLIGGYRLYGGSGPLGETTSLALFIFKCKYGLISFTKLMASYQFTAGFLLLLITTILSIATLILQRKFAGRY